MLEQVSCVVGRKEGFRERIEKIHTRLKGSKFYWFHVMRYNMEIALYSKCNNITHLTAVTWIASNR